MTDPSASKISKMVSTSVAAYEKIVSNAQMKFNLVGDVNNPKFTVHQAKKFVEDYGWKIIDRHKL